MSDLKTTAQDTAEGVTVNYYQDVEPVLDICARERRVDREATSFQKSSEFKRTMIIPLNILMKIKEEHGLDFMNPEHSKAIAKILKSPEYALFRTTDKKRR